MGASPGAPLGDQQLTASWGWGGDSAGGGPGEAGCTPTSVMPAEASPPGASTHEGEPGPWSSHT